ncbi:MAG TPA: 16S rRNA (cytosine(1402)-N(4))-methyltransferase RsmH [Fimbriimonadaceae bacterium]|nr:16S rRNA (cytosine(1402)-N(4))-methyltransferase RsmH [Fimbriimonadaceae bacterium]HRJ95175.1 16S rRNA (cytosine(1402)-N(4))-methyltransferase RsmH [Fimbriimonadaceae bacterium]
MHHEPVMLMEVLSVLPLRPGAAVVDGTLGLAGHAREMAKRIAPGGWILGLDWDEEMLKEAGSRLEGIEGVETTLRKADYRELPEVLSQEAALRHRAAQADAILLDFGLNSAQIDDPNRGISFREDGPLDMRMDRSKGESASSLLNRLSPIEIERILEEYGDENWAKRIAQVIVDRRKNKPLRTTQDLVDCVLAAVPPSMREKRIHPATRTFQAVRIAVNHELDDLQETIESIANMLAPDGVLCVLSYHSGEDRAAKRAMRDLAKIGFDEIIKKPLVPTPEELAVNPKSRSAKLRAIRRQSIS